MAEAEVDAIQLSVPASADMRAVVEVAISVMARRWGLSDDEVTAARSATGDAVIDLVQSGGEPIRIEILATPHHLAIRLSRGDAVRVLDAPTT